MANENSTATIENSAEIEARIQEVRQKYNKKNVEDTYQPTGSIALDIVCSDGKGFPEKKMIQLTGDSGCGKSTMLLHACKTACARGKRCYYLDSEYATNQSQYVGVGLLPYIENGLFNPMDVQTFEKAEEIMDSVLGTADFDSKGNLASNEVHGDLNAAIVVVDSITSLLPEKLLGESVGKVLPGAQAQLATKFLNKYTAIMSMTDSPATLVLINQVRTKISFIATTVGEAGGYAQKYLPDIRLFMKVKAKLEKTMETIEGKKPTPYGAECEIWAEKNRHANPFIKVPITVIFGKGISNMSFYENALKKEKALSIGGANHKCKIGDLEFSANGKANFHQKIKENMQVVREFLDERGAFNLIKE